MFFIVIALGARVHDQQDFLNLCGQSTDLYNSCLTASDTVLPDRVQTEVRPCSVWPPAVSDSALIASIHMFCSTLHNVITSDLET